MLDTTLTIVGNLTDTPELRFTTSGTPVVNFTIASTPRTFDKTRNEWTDGAPLFMRCTAWRYLAEHIAESLERGTRVIAQGTLTQHEYEAKDGTGKRTTVELTVAAIGPELTYATARVKRTTTARKSDPFADLPHTADTVPAGADGPPPF